MSRDGRSRNEGWVLVVDRTTECRMESGGNGSERFLESLP